VFTWLNVAEADGNFCFLIFEITDDVITARQERVVAILAVSSVIAFGITQERRKFLTFGEWRELVPLREFVGFLSVIIRKNSAKRPNDVTAALAFEKAYKFHRLFQPSESLGQTTEQNPKWFSNDDMIRIPDGLWLLFAQDEKHSSQESKSVEAEEDHFDIRGE